jgi:LysM repeat protein
LQLAAATQPRGHFLRYLVPAALALLFVAMIIVVVTSVSGSGTSSSSTHSRHAAAHKLPPYWTVRPGDTYAEIARKTGLTINELEQLNPTTDPSSLVPGQRLKLSRHPRSRPRRLGPLFWTVRRGESFGLIAAKTGISIVTLEQLNPQLKPATLQPGDQVRLRQ